MEQEGLLSPCFHPLLYLRYCDQAWLYAILRAVLFWGSEIGGDWRGDTNGRL
jgi:hypothetical protein